MRISHNSKLLDYFFVREVPGVLPQTGINLTTKMIRHEPHVEVARFQNRVCYFDDWTAAQAYLSK